MLKHTLRKKKGTISEALFIKELSPWLNTQDILNTKDIFAYYRYLFIRLVIYKCFYLFTYLS